MKRLSEDFIKNQCDSYADFSRDGKYRYSLSRQWGSGDMIAFIMLNPSTADEYANDPTVDKCMKWSMKWGYSVMVILNLFALRSTDPQGLYQEQLPIGIRNNEKILSVCDQAGMIICGWGNHGRYLYRDNQVIEMLQDYDLFAMKINKNGSPGHPLYLRNNTEPFLWKETSMDLKPVKPRSTRSRYSIVF